MSQTTETKKKNEKCKEKPNKKNSNVRRLLGLPPRTAPLRGLPSLIRTTGELILSYPQKKKQRAIALSSCRRPSPSMFRRLSFSEFSKKTRNDALCPGTTWASAPPVSLCRCRRDEKGGFPGRRREKTRAKRGQSRRERLFRNVSLCLSRFLPLSTLSMRPL